MPLETLIRIVEILKIIYLSKLLNYWTDLIQFIILKLLRTRNHQNPNFNHTRVDFTKLKLKINLYYFRSLWNFINFISIWSSWNFPNFNWDYNEFLIKLSLENYQTIFYPILLFSYLKFIKYISLHKMIR